MKSENVEGRFLESIQCEGGGVADLKGMWFWFCIQSKNIMCNSKGKIDCARHDDTEVNGVMCCFQF